MPNASFDSPIRRLTVIERDGPPVAALSRRNGTASDATPLINDVIMQLLAYFTGDLKHFNLPLAPAPTVEAKAVRGVMLAIPCGATATYGEPANRTGASACAAGQACGSNRLPIIVPYHHVVGADGFGY